MIPLPLGGFELNAREVSRPQPYSSVSDSPDISCPYPVHLFIWCEGNPSATIASQRGDPVSATGWADRDLLTRPCLFISFLLPVWISACYMVDSVTHCTVIMTGSAELYHQLTWMYHDTIGIKTERAVLNCVIDPARCHSRGSGRTACVPRD